MESFCEVIFKKNMHLCDELILLYYLEGNLLLLSLAHSKWTCTLLPPPDFFLNWDKKSRTKMYVDITQLFAFFYKFLAHFIKIGNELLSEYHELFIQIYDKK